MGTLLSDDMLQYRNNIYVQHKKSIGAILKYVKRLNKSFDSWMENSCRNMNTIFHATCNVKHAKIIIATSRIKLLKHISQRPIFLPNRNLCLRPCLAGLHERLQHQLRPEPCQTGALPSAPAPEPRKSRSLEHFGLRGARKSWLRPAPCGSSRLLPTLPPGGHAVGGHRRELATAAEPRRPTGTRAGGAG